VTAKQVQQFIGRDALQPSSMTPVRRPVPRTRELEPLEDQATQPVLIFVALLILAASVVVATTGPANLSRTHAKQVAVPDRR
jgi:anti-sigma factor RsiW